MARWERTTWMCIESTNWIVVTTHFGVRVCGFLIGVEWSRIDAGYVSVLV